MRLEFTEDDLKIELCPECHGSKYAIRTTHSEQASVTEQDNCDACVGRGLKLTRA
jgi:DnaJ-class molecular chaperone